MPLKHLPAEARPREKLLARGPAALADTELLALILRTGVAGNGVLQMAQQLLSRFGGVAGLLNTSADDLKTVKGLGGSAKRAELLAVLELARRAMAQQLSAQKVLDSPQALHHYLRLQLDHKPHEVFVALFLDSGQRLVAFEELFRGTVGHTSIYPREIVLRALHHQASAVVLAHNHPGGQATPSEADIATTRVLKAALALIDVQVLDHLIVAPGAIYSLGEHALI